MKEINYSRFVFQPLNSNMYIFNEKDKALIVDPCQSEEAYKQLKEAGIKYLLIVLTHEHYDHVSGISYWKERFPTFIVAHDLVKEKIENPHNRIAQGYMATFIGKPREVIENAKKQCRCVCSFVDISFNSECELRWNNHSIKMINTPGHTKGSICISYDQSYLLTGDSLLQNEAVITRFPSGSEKDYKEVTLPFFKSLHKEMIVLPGHGEACKLGELL